MAYAHVLALGEGLPKATCATFGMVTTVALESVFATYAPNDAAVCASYCALMTSVGIALFVGVLTTGETLGTFQSLQFSRMKGRFGAFLRMARGNVGNARRPSVTTLCSVSYGTHSPQATPEKRPLLRTPIPAGSSFGAAHVDAMGAGSP